MEKKLSLTKGRDIHKYNIYSTSLLYCFYFSFILLVAWTWFRCPWENSYKLRMLPNNNNMESNMWLFVHSSLQEEATRGWKWIKKSEHDKTSENNKLHFIKLLISLGFSHIIIGFPDHIVETCWKIFVKLPKG